MVIYSDSAVLGRLPLTLTDFHDYRAQGSRMMIYDLRLPPGYWSPVFLLSSVPMMTALAARHFGLPPRSLSLRVSWCPSRLRRHNFSSSPLRPHQRLRWHCRLRTASPLGRADKQPLLPVPRNLTLIMISDPTGFPGRLILGSTLFRAFRALGCLWLLPRAHLGLQRVSRRYIPSDHDRGEPLGTPRLRLSNHSELPSAPSAEFGRPWRS